MITESMTDWPEGVVRNKLGNTVYRAKDQFESDSKSLRDFMLCGIESNRVSCTYNVGVDSILYLMTRVRNPRHPAPVDPTGALICMWLGEPGEAFLSIDGETINTRGMEVVDVRNWIEDQLDKLEEQDVS
ncbi:hypothetical protein uav_154 [Pseudomonas phage UAVern]|uniref:Uncharacterized protein n=1 Tax=Pseudomonas phage UAVern TaxID=2856997 RepID=A0A975UY48_9CAUD|nr:hypothetical protein uav_154 [Pseudomonas phage UAVern]